VEEETKKEKNSGGGRSFRKNFSSQALGGVFA
jgi:hypothetical protein